MFSKLNLLNVKHNCLKDINLIYDLIPKNNLFIFTRAADFIIK